MEKISGFLNEMWGEKRKISSEEFFQILNNDWDIMRSNINIKVLISSQGFLESFTTESKNLIINSSDLTVNINLPDHTTSVKLINKEIIQVNLNNLRIWIDEGSHITITRIK